MRPYQPKTRLTRDDGLANTDLPKPGELVQYVGKNRLSSEMNGMALIRIFAGVLALMVSTMPAVAIDWRAEGQVFAELNRAAHKKDWDKADQLAAQITLPAALTLVDWLRLREGTDDFNEYVRFLTDHGDWPGLTILRKSGEAALRTGTDPSVVQEYFRVQPPQTGNGAIRYAEALQRLGLSKEARAAIQDGWKSLPFNANEHAEALQLFGTELQPIHLIRIDNLVWQKRYREANRLLPLLEREHQRLADARMALQKRANGVDSRIRSLTVELKNDPGLSYDRVVWRLLEDAEERALALMIETSSSHADLVRPELWAPRRLSLARWLMREQRYQEAYRVASNHHLMDGDYLRSLTSVSAADRDRAERSRLRHYADLEWLNGYLQLRFLDDPSAAVRHFRAFQDIVDTPISLGRAGYWLGLAYEAIGDEEQAARAFASAAQQQTSFYGQLAAERTDQPADRRLAVPTMASHHDSSHLLAIDVVQAGLLAHYSGHESQAAWFLAHVAETLNAEDSRLLAALAFDHGAYFASVKVAKEGVKNGFADIVHLFPLVGIEKYNLPVSPELALSVARQETEFRVNAVSNKGAVGFMQIKPSTGDELARAMGLKGAIKNLLRDRETNVLLGSQYLRDRLDQFSDSYILALAAYNAGPARVEDWLARLGDPRSGHIDPIDWIEHLPFGETRNYVMRNMEALTVYRMRLAGKPLPINLSNKLARGIL